MLPFIRFCSETLELPRGLMFAAPREGRARKHARHHVLFAFLIAAVLGTERLTHLELLADDPLLLKLTRLSTWPVRKVFSNALADVADAGVAQLLGRKGNMNALPDGTPGHLGPARRADARHSA